MFVLVVSQSLFICKQKNPLILFYVGGYEDGGDRDNPKQGSRARGRGAEGLARRQPLWSGDPPCRPAREIPEGRLRPCLVKIRRVEPEKRLPLPTEMGKRLPPDQVASRCEYIVHFFHRRNRLFYL